MFYNYKKIEKGDILPEFASVIISGNKICKFQFEENEFLLGFTFKKQGYATRKSPRLEIPRLKINGYSDIQTLENILNYYYDN